MLKAAKRFQIWENMSSKYSHMSYLPSQNFPRNIARKATMFGTLLLPPSFPPTSYFKEVAHPRHTRRCSKQGQGTKCLLLRNASVSRRKKAIMVHRQMQEDGKKKKWNDIIRVKIPTDFLFQGSCISETHASVFQSGHELSPFKKLKSFETEKTIVAHL